MENKNQTKQLLLIILSIVLCILGLVYPILEIVTNKAISLEIVVKIACYLFALYYLLIGYKKPHGNLMKILFLFFAFVVVIQSIAFADSNVNAAYCSGVAALFIAYSGGRLNKLKNNQVSAIIVLVLLLLSYAIGLTNTTEESFLLKVTNLDLVIEWAAINLAYIVRFDTHKEVGLKESKE